MPASPVPRKTHPSTQLSTAGSAEGGPAAEEGGVTVAAEAVAAVEEPSEGTASGEGEHPEV